MIFSDFVNAPPSENGGLRRFLRRKNRIENEEGRGFGRGTALEQSESGAGQNIGPGGADDRTRGFAAGETALTKNRHGRASLRRPSVIYILE